MPLHWKCAHTRVDWWLWIHNFFFFFFLQWHPINWIVDECRVIAYFGKWTHISSYCVNKKYRQILILSPVIQSIDLIDRGKKKHTRIQNQYLSMNDERNNRKYYLHLQRFFMCVQKVNVDTNLFDWNAAWQLMRLVQCDDLLSLIKLNWLDLKRDDGKCIWQFDFFVFFCTRQGNYAESVWIYKHILGGMCHDIQNVVWAFNLISQEYIYGWNEWEISSTWIKTLVKVKTNTRFSSVPATIEPLLVSFYPYPCYNLYDDYFMVLFQVGLEILNS